MQLNELTGIKKFPKISYNLIEFMERLGFKYLGKGAKGYTFLGKKQVIKIFKEDLGYQEYIKWIKTVPTEYKDYVPKVVDYYTYSPNREYKLIKLPLYFKLNENEQDILDLWNIIMYWYDLKENLFPMNFLKTKIDNIENLIEILNNANFFESHHGIKISDMINFDINFYNFMNYFILNRPKGRNLDLHNGNFMSNGKNIVLIDPLI